jgi:hypothetical protein
MGSVTYWAVLPFVADEEGNLLPDEAVECQSPAAASARARALALGKAGAVAFSRTGDPETGEWSDAVVVCKVGEVPADLEMVSGP